MEMVESFGTENRNPSIQIPKSAKIYEYIIFKLHNIKSICINGKWMDVHEALKVLSKNYDFGNYDIIDHEFNPDDCKDFYDAEKSFYDNI